jgi:hypothetical protein
VADGVTSTTPLRSDDLASRFFYDAIANRPGVFGFPPIPVVSSTKLWDAYKTNPAEFRSDENTTFRNSIMPNKRAEETISALFFRGDAQFFTRRLRLVGGIRAEQTNIRPGPRPIPRNHQRRPDGRILGANGRPLPIVTNTSCSPIRSSRLPAWRARGEGGLRWFRASTRVSTCAKTSWRALVVYLDRSAEFQPVRRRHHAARSRSRFQHEQPNRRQ